MVDKYWTGMLVLSQRDSNVVAIRPSAQIPGDLNARNVF